MQQVRRKIFKLLMGSLALTASLALSGCNDPQLQFTGTDITGTKLGQGWTLTGMDGKTYTSEMLKGKVSIVFFGYTQCPDVCPTSMAEMTEVMKLLGDKASQVQVVMISVDPERDTQDVMKAYVTGFDPRFIGLTGTVDQVKKAAGSFKAYFAKSPKGQSGDYSMDHSAMFYLIDAKGESRVLLNNQVGATAIKKDIDLLLR